MYKGLKGFWVGKGETLLPKALEKNIRYAKLLALNDLPDQALQTDMFIFIEKKRKVGTEEFHIVKADENMVLIAQKEAILLSSLYAFNNLIPGQEPETGERLTLQYKSYDTPKTKQQFLKEFENGKSAETIITKVEKKSITEAVPALAFEEKEKARQAQQQAKIEAEEKKQIEKKRIAALTTIDTILIEPKQTVIAAAKSSEVQPPIKTIEPVVEKVIETNTAPEKEVASTSNKTNQPVVKNELNDSKNKDIIDAAKAKRMEELLNAEPLDKSSTPEVITEQAQIKQQTSESEPTQEVITVPTPVVEKITPVVPTIKRTYDETDVNDSVKDLKKKFDQIIYSPRPARKIDTTKRSIQKPIAVSKEDEKKAVVVTETGIKRDLKKAAANKEAELRKAESKKKGKEDAKKGSHKKVATVAKKSKNKKEASASDKKKASPARKKSTKKK